MKRQSESSDVSTPLPRDTHAAEIARSEISFGLILGEETTEGQFWIKKGLRRLRRVANTDQ